MPSFAYAAQNASGTETNGMIDALSLQNARDTLKEKGLFVTEIHEATMGERGIEKQWVYEEEPEEQKVPKPDQNISAIEPLPKERRYVPLIGTLRLYGGWLMAWYMIIYLLGAYQVTGKSPFVLPIIEGLFYSKIVLIFTFATFLFLLLSTLHRSLHGGKRTEWGFLLLWVGFVVFFGVSV